MAMLYRNIKSAVVSNKGQKGKWYHGHFWPEPAPDKPKVTPTVPQTLPDMKKK